MAILQKDHNGWGFDKIYDVADNANPYTHVASQLGDKEHSTAVQTLFYDDSVDKFTSEIKLPHGAQIIEVSAEIRAGIAFTGGTAPALEIRDKATPADLITIDVTDATHSATIAAEGVAYATATALGGGLAVPQVGETTIEFAVTGTPTAVTADFDLTVYFRLPA